MQETWKDIPDYEGLYQVSNFGRIKSLKRTKYSKGGSIQIVHEKIRKQSLFNNGYLYVNLCINGKNKSKSVHRIIAESFIPNPENKKEVNHIDCNKLNNHISNLEWCTAKENSLHRVENGLSASGEKNPKAKLKEVDIPVIRKLLNDGVLQKVIAKQFNVDPSQISQINLGKHWAKVA